MDQVNAVTAPLAQSTVQGMDMSALNGVPTEGTPLPMPEPEQPQVAAAPAEQAAPSPEENFAANLSEAGIEANPEDLMQFARPEQLEILQMEPVTPEDRATMITTARAVMAQRIAAQTNAQMQLTLPSSPIALLYGAASGR